MVDDFLQFGRQLNILAESLSEINNSALKLILTSSHASWTRRTKSPIFMAKGNVQHISRLSNQEIDNLLNLLDQQNSIRELISGDFSRLLAGDRKQHLRQRCASDMYVCLKNIFAFESLDTILLREYSDLPDDLRDIYRHVAALQAAGTRVHRQLVINALGVRADVIAGVSQQLAGIVDEFDVDTSKGIYGWETRHLVIATKIAEYKFSDQSELRELLIRVVGALNPGINIELCTLRDLCNAEYGINRLQNHEDQIELLRRIVALAPGERVPRHRLISALIKARRAELADQAIREAESMVGIDSPINRYKVQHAILRAQITEGIMDEDRIAILRNAERIAQDGLRMFQWDKYSYIVYGDVAIKFAEFSKDITLLDDAIDRAKTAGEKILDEMLFSAIDRFEQRRRQLKRAFSD